MRKPGLLNKISNAPERKLWLSCFLVFAFIYGLITWLTFAKHPLFGEMAVRGTLNEEPNLTHTYVYHEIQKTLPEGKYLDIHDCGQCFPPFTNYHNPKIENGLHHSYLQPSWFYMYEGQKYPVFFSDRIGGFTYGFVKILKENFSLKTSLITFHYLVGVLTIFFFGYFVRKAYGTPVAIVAMFLMATSAIHGMNNGNFISKKAEPLFLWTMASSFFVPRLIPALMLSMTSFFSVFLVKSTTLLNLGAGVLLISPLQWWKRKSVLIGGIVFFAFLTFIVWQIDRRDMVRGYTVTSEYVKEFKYFEILIFDFILMITSPLQFLEYHLGLDGWHYPFTTYIPTQADFEALDPFTRLKFISWPGFFHGLIFLLPLFFWKKLEFTKKYLPPYLSLIALHAVIFVAAHKYFTFSIYTWGSIGIVYLISSLFLFDLFRIFPDRKNVLIGITAFYLGLHLWQLGVYIKVYRQHGPIPTFSHNLYQDVARDLEKQNINHPLMFFISEVGNLENHSSKVKPVYIHEKSLQTFDDLFKQSRGTEVLLQLKIDWYETNWPRTISKDVVLKAARKLNVTIEHIKDYYYRDYVVYWLFRFKHNDPSGFADEKYFLTDQKVKELYDNIPLYR